MKYNIGKQLRFCGGLLALMSVPLIIVTGRFGLIAVAFFGMAISSLAAFSKCGVCGFRLFEFSRMLPDLTLNGRCPKCGAYVE